MVNYQQVRVRLTNAQLNKLKSGANLDRNNIKIKLKKSVKNKTNK